MFESIVAKPQYFAIAQLEASWEVYFGKHWSRWHWGGRVVLWHDARLVTTLRQREAAPRELRSQLCTELSWGLTKGEDEDIPPC